MRKQKHLIFKIAVFLLLLGIAVHVMHIETGVAELNNQNRQAYEEQRHILIDRGIIAGE